MALHTPHLLAPRVTPDGTISWEAHEPEIARRIREGDSEIGWLGDERLSLHVTPNFGGGLLPRWEVWRDHETVAPTLVCSRVAQRINGHAILALLALHDSRTHDTAAEHLAARDAREATARAGFLDEAEGKADRLAWALARDLDLPAPHGKLYRLGGD